MSPVEFVGAFTWLITFREHADSTHMTLLIFNSTQHNNMMHNTSKIFFVVKCCNNNWSVWFLNYFLIEQSLLSWTLNPTERPMNDQLEEGTIHTTVIYHRKKDMLLFYGLM